MATVGGLNKESGITGTALMRIIVFLAATSLFSSSPALADLCNRQWLQQADGRDVQRHVQAAGADVDQVCNNLGSRPLHLALIFEGVDSSVVEALLNAGADVEAANRFGDSPRTLADAAHEEGRLDRRVHGLFRRRFEARAEAERNLCDPSWWRGFYRMDKEGAERRINAVLQSPGLDVNTNCGGGNRPLHYALQDSLTPLTEGAYWGIATFMYADGVNLAARNNAGRSIVDLIEVRYDHQVRGNFMNLLRSLCSDQITVQEYGRQNGQFYSSEMGIYADMRILYSKEDRQSIYSRLNMEYFGTTCLGAKSYEQLCAKYR